MAFDRRNGHCLAISFDDPSSRVLNELRGARFLEYLEAPDEFLSFLRSNWTGPFTYYARGVAGRYDPASRVCVKLCKLDLGDYCVTVSDVISVPDAPQHNPMIHDAPPISIFSAPPE
jgi:hypothetical protein